MLSGATLRNGHAFVWLPTGLSELERVFFTRAHILTYMVASEQVLSSYQSAFSIPKFRY